MKHYKAPWSPLLVILWTLLTAWLLGQAFVEFRHRGAASWVGWLLVALVVGCAFFTIRGYTVTPALPGLGLAQCLRPAQSDECAGGPAADGAGGLDPIARAPQSQWLRPAPLPTHGGFRPPSAGPSPAASVGAAALPAGARRAALAPVE